MNQILELNLIEVVFNTFRSNFHINATWLALIIIILPCFWWFILLLFNSNIWIFLGLSAILLRPITEMIQNILPLIRICHFDSLKCVLLFTIVSFCGLITIKKHFFDKVWKLSKYNCVYTNCPRYTRSVVLNRVAANNCN